MQVSEKHACKMAAAMYKELQEPGPIQSLGFIRELDRLHQTGHDNRLPDVLLNFKLQAPVPIHYEDIGLTQSHPTLRLRSFIETFNKPKGRFIISWLETVLPSYEAFGDATESFTRSMTFLLIMLTICTLVWQ